MIGHGYDDNTTYSVMSASEATTGTATSARTISAKVLHDKIEEMQKTNAEMGQGYGEVDSITRTGKNMLPYPYEDTTKLYMALHLRTMVTVQSLRTELLIAVITPYLYWQILHLMRLTRLERVLY